MVKKEEVELFGEIQESNAGINSDEYIEELKDFIWKHKIKRINVALVPIEMGD